MRNTKREQIIEAIKTTARNNNGVPLGVRAFERETGFKQSEWRGIYWARWSDAIKETGLTSTNTFTLRTDSSILLERIIPAIRHFGKLPTIAEMRLYKRANPSFPNEGTIHNHFPAKTDLISALITYAEAKPQLQDIISLFAQFDISEKTSSKPAMINEGHVYLFKSGSFYKIGKTGNLERRVKEVSIALPESLTIVHTIKTDDPDGIEAYWHRRFNEHRAKGEWFKLDKSHIAAFKRRNFQ